MKIGGDSEQCPLASCVGFLYKWGLMENVLSPLVFVRLFPFRWRLVKYASSPRFSWLSWILVRSKRIFNSADIKFDMSMSGLSMSSNYRAIPPYCSKCSFETEGMRNEEGVEKT